MQLRQEQVRNVLLRRIDPSDFEAIAPALERVRVDKGQIVIEAGQPLRYAYFPESGLSSVLSPGEGDRRVEVGAFGKDGMVSSASLLGVDEVCTQTLVQIEGTWLRLPVDVVATCMRERARFREVMLHYVQMYLLQVTTTAQANGSHKIEARLARWLLMAQDRVEADDLPLTHEFLALMLAVRRAGVTVALHILEGEHMIKATRGNIRVLDRDALVKKAGSIYGPAETEYERLIGAFSSKRPVPPGA